MSFAAGWPTLVEARGFSVDAEPTTLGGKLSAPLQSGVVMWGNGGVWVTVGAPTSRDRSSQPFGSVYCIDLPMVYSFYIMLIECEAPTFLSNLFRHSRLSDSKYCFDSLNAMLNAYGFVTLHDHTVIDADGQPFEL